MTLGANMRVHLVRMIILSEPEVNGQMLTVVCYTIIPSGLFLHNLTFTVIKLMLNYAK